MNPALVPNFCALLAFLCAFRPLAKRAGKHTNPWFVGWIFLLAHLALQMVGGGETTHATFRLFCHWTLEIGAIWFLRAAASAPRTRLSFLLTATMVVPVFLVATLAAFESHAHWWNAAAALSLATPWIVLRRLPHALTEVRQKMCKAFAVVAVLVAPIAAFDVVFALSLIHCLLFMGAAIMYWELVRRGSPGIVTAVVGLVFWGFTYPISLLVFRSGDSSSAMQAVWYLPSYFVAFGMILTLIEEHVQHTEELAMHDSLTALPNRRLFEDRLEQAVLMAPKTGCMLACVVIDVDNFKQSNDRFGHHIGDGLLQAVATRLGWHMQPGDTLARTGGDEFAAVLPRIQSLEHLRFIVGAMMSATSAPVVVGRKAMRVGLSIGIAVHPTAGEDAESLRRSADAAMYDAKRNGGNQFAYFGGDPDEAAHLVPKSAENYWVAEALMGR